MLDKPSPFTNKATFIVRQLTYHMHKQNTQEPGSSVGYVLACGASGPGSTPARLEYFTIVNFVPLYTTHRPGRTELSYKRT